MKRPRGHPVGLAPLTLAATLALIMCTLAPAAMAKPVKETLSGRIGWEADATSKGPICTVASKDTCQPAQQSSEPGAFRYPEGVAVESVAGPHQGHVYVADRGNHRIQELTPTGQFVAMFGWEVNATKSKEGAPQAARNVCTAESKDACQAGVEGPSPEQFGADGPTRLAIDPANGDIYASDNTSGSAQRVQKFTPGGAFVLELGKEVNASTKGNLCTAEEVEKAGVKCVGAAPRGEASTEPFLTVQAMPLAAGGPEDLLYVGDARRIQAFEANGKYKRELSLTAISATPESRVQSLTVDKEGGLYLLYQIGVEEAFHKFIAQPAKVIYRLTPSGEEVNDGHFPLMLTPRRTNNGEFNELEVQVSAIAITSTGRLAVSQDERSATGPAATDELFGSLLDASTGRLVTSFATPSPFGIEAVAFGEGDALYATGSQELFLYAPKAVGELVSTLASCTPGLEHDSDVTLVCNLNGEVNPWGVAETAAWFQWGHTAALTSETPKQPLATAETLMTLHAAIEAKPNETLFYRLAGEDEPVKAPELLSSETTAFTTPSVPPKILGEPSASFVSPDSAVLYGQLNPEHTATKYEFQYGPCTSLEACPERAQAEPSESEAYGGIGFTQEVSALRSGTTYTYRLLAVNGKGEAAVNERGGAGVPEGHFQTPAVSPASAATGSASAITVTSAVATGTVSTAGLPATYVFELGVYEGAATQYGVVFSGNAPGSSGPAEEALALTGLQPSTEYAYRIAVKRGLETASGEPATFTTQGLPSLLSVATPLALLVTPPISFPAPANSSATHTTGLTRQQLLAQALRSCRKKPLRQRAACARRARAKYANSKHARGRKKG